MQLNKFGVTTLAGSLMLTTQALLPPVTFAQQTPVNNNISMIVPVEKSVPKSPLGRTTGSGVMNAIDATGRQLGICPLKHTDVHAQVSGYVAAVTVEQVFENPYDESIEAIYTFPLSDTSAVNEVLMEVGGRTVHATIQKRTVARDIYNGAKRRGKTASLLEQERTNIFTQSVANIPPHTIVKVKLKYVDVLPYVSGRYEFVFPMVVGPRYMPGSPIGQDGSGWSADTDAVPDASRISPPTMPEDKRAGHDISLRVEVNEGMPITNLQSALHQVQVASNSANSQTVTLSPSDSIPNRDFVLSWQVAQNQIKSGCLAYKNGDEGFFNLMIVPPARPKIEQIAPRELNFIIDRSGSQSGLPLLKAKETMLYILDRLNPNDTFQIISFSNSTEKLFYQPMPPSQQAIAEAKKYIAMLQANGGTEMKQAVEEATSAPAPAHRLRIFTIMTDGYIGNDNEIVSLVKKTRGVSRWFSFGTGNSVNRLLIDGVAKAGGGEAQYVLLNSPGDKVAKEFFDRISSPILTDISLSFTGVRPTHVLPTSLNDVWAERPVYISGQYATAGKGVATIKGFSGGRPYTQRVDLNLPEKSTANSVLPSIWARLKVDELMETINARPGDLSSKKEAQEQIEDLGLKYSLVTDYTSFVAVDETGPSTEPTGKTLTVGVEAPDGVSLEKIFNGRSNSSSDKRIRSGSTGGGADSVYGPFGAFGSKPIPPSALNLFQVEPTVIDERRYVTGRDERHQKTSPTLPTGSIAKMHSALASPSRIELDVADGRNQTRILQNNSLAQARSSGKPPAIKETVISALGMPKGKSHDADLKKSDEKLSPELKKMLETSTSKSKVIAVEIEFSGSRDELLAILEKLNIRVDSDVITDNSVVIVNISLSRTAKLAQLNQINSLKLFEPTKK